MDPGSLNAARRCFKLPGHEKTRNHFPRRPRSRRSRGLADDSTSIPGQIPESVASLQQQNGLLTALITENEHLSNLVAEANSTPQRPRGGIGPAPP